jgi:DNA-binding GntR family transcriptional regulator
LTDVVRARLRAALVEGEFPQGSKLPNEDQLCRRFDVSRVTIREAVRGLIEDGFVVRRQGSGTFVSRRPMLRNSLDRNFSYTDYLEASGVRPGRKLLGLRRVAADDEIAEILRLPPGASIVEVRRLRTADGRPAIYSIDRLSAELAGSSATDRTAMAGSLYRILTAAGHPIAHAEAILNPTVADRDLAAVLEVGLGSPLQFMRQVDFDEAGEPVMLSDEWHVTSVMELRVYRRGPGPVS